MEKISGQYYTIWYYYGEYYIGQTKVYREVIWADDEFSAKEQFFFEHPSAVIKNIN